MKTYKSNKEFMEGEKDNMSDFGIVTADYVAAINELKEIAKTNPKAKDYIHQIANTVYASRLEAKANKICADIQCLIEIAKAGTREDLEKISQKLENTDIAKEESELE